jgi:hypothetical protein
MSWPDRIKMGLERPKDWDIGKRWDFCAMRKQIYEAQMDSAIICQAMRAADYNGLNAEDRYTLLAYEALIALETYWKMASDAVSLNPMPPFLKPADVKSR